jgi:sec-independent protein translocase protein TatB
MFDFDATKLMIVGVLALIVLGPQELPRVMRQLGQMLGKVRRMAGEFQGQFMDAMREAELEDIRKQVNKLGDDAKSSVSLDMNLPDPADELRKAAERAPSTPAMSGADLGLPEPEPFKPVTSEDLAAAFEPQPDPTLARPAPAAQDTAPAPEPAPAPAKAADNFYLRPGAARATQTAGVELAQEEEITFRKAPPTPEPAAPADAPRRRSARPTGA